MLLMMNNELIYVDTNVFMDFLLGRDKSAFDLFMKTISCEFCMIISDLVVKELHEQELDVEMQNLFSMLEHAHKLFIDKVRDDDRTNVSALLRVYPTHYADAVHKVIAKRNNVRYFVTKNVKDFICFEDILVRRPDAI